MFLESCPIPVQRAAGGGTYMRRIQDIMWQSQEAGVAARRCKGRLKGTPTANAGQFEYRKEH